MFCVLKNCEFIDLFYFLTTKHCILIIFAIIISAFILGLFFSLFLISLHDYYEWIVS